MSHKAGETLNGVVHGPTDSGQIVVIPAVSELGGP